MDALEKFSLEQKTLPLGIEREYCRRAAFIQNQKILFIPPPPSVHSMKSFVAARSKEKKT